MDTQIYTAAHAAAIDVNLFFAVVFGLPTLAATCWHLYRFAKTRYEAINPPCKEVQACREAQRAECIEEFHATHLATLAEIGDYPQSHAFRVNGRAIVAAAIATIAKCKTGELPTLLETNSYRAMQIYSDYDCRNGLKHFCA